MWLYELKTQFLLYARCLSRRGNQLLGYEIWAKTFKMNITAHAHVLESVISKSRHFWLVDRPSNQCFRFLSRKFIPLHHQLTIELLVPWSEFYYPLSRDLVVIKRNKSKKILPNLGYFMSRNWFWSATFSRWYLLKCLTWNLSYFLAINTLDVLLSHQSFVDSNNFRHHSHTEYNRDVCP